jgi:xylan 1,4-beta-xylosidase
MFSRKLTFFAVFAFLFCSAAVQGQTSPQVIKVDATANADAFPHFWEQAFGSGRAILTLRESYRRDLREVKQVTDFKYVRFHAIFHDEVGVYDEDRQGRPIYNFSYVDQIYDGLLDNGVRPFVEISFMPKKLAARPDYHAFWYKQIVSEPSDYAKWDALVTAFTRHLVDRYGIDEVSKWYFEVWNEPNIDFFSGIPKQEKYFELYDHTAKAVKAVDSRLRVGGPATAQAAWVGDLIDHTTKNNVPLDFVSSHIYGDEKVQNVFKGSTEQISRDDMVYRGTKKMYDEIKSSARPNLPLIVSEFNAPFKEKKSRDTIFEGPWLANTIRQCDGLTDMMSFWTFSDVFEEKGVVKEPFYGGMGLMAAGGIPKPSFQAFSLLHLLGDQRIKNDADDVLVTKRNDGTLVIALWNIVDPGTAGAAKAIRLDFEHLKSARVTTYRLDEQHGDTLAAYRQMGSPKYPSRAEVQKLREVAKLKPETQSIKGNTLTVDLPVNGLTVLEVRR